MKTVVRKYNTKNGPVTKVYTYEDDKYNYKHKSTRGKVLVDKSGNLNKENINALFDSIDNSSTMNSMEKLAYKQQLQAVILQAKGNKKKLTTTGAAGYLSDSKIERFFANMGWTVSEFAKYYNLKESELMNNDNWNWRKNIFTSALGRQLEIKFTYDGSGVTEL